MAQERCRITSNRGVCAGWRYSVAQERCRITSNRGVYAGWGARSGPGQSAPAASGSAIGGPLPTRPAR